MTARRLHSPAPAGVESPKPTSGVIVSLAALRKSVGRHPTRPFVFVNMAMTADGKIATANRRIASFGSPRDLAHLYELRATADAVMCGARTVVAGDVVLDTGPARFRRARRRRGLSESHLRIVVTGRGRVDLAGRLFADRSSPLVLLTTEQAGTKRLRAMAAVADEVVVCGRDRIDFSLALHWLASRWKVKRLLAEGGGELNAGLFAAQLVDELHLTLCPLIFGGATAPTIADQDVPRRLRDAARFHLKSARRVGDELFCVFAASPGPA